MIRTTEGIQLGQLVTSKAGRDKDKEYLVVKILDESFVYLVDGNLRKLKSPKRKNIKHVQATNIIAKELQQKLLNGDRIDDEGIRQLIVELMG
ncbi:MAG: KOW domain-containing RNA-binding protein [Bacillota bacterium]|nr:KOW domain-containing RNA-binding protein [Bacillota bacterium]